MLRALYSQLNSQLSSFGSPASRSLGWVLVATRELAAGAVRAIAIIREGLRLDWRIVALSACSLVILLPSVTRYTDNPQMLAAFSNDEPFLVMALDATTKFPWGNPGNFFDAKKNASQSLPEYWGTLRYGDINYYGGAMYALTFPPYAVLRAIGAPPFPTAPVLMRLLVLGAGVASLIVLYNIGKSRGFSSVGLFAAAYIGTNSYFTYYATTIHPDTLQLLFGLLAFVAAVRYAEIRDRAALIAFGLFCGCVQATKVGGFWLAPAALLTLAIGSQKSDCKEFARNAAILAGAGLAGWFVAAPYTFLDPYYLRTLIAIWSMISATPFGEANPSAWFNALRAHAGDVALGVSGFAIGYALWSLRRPRQNPAPIIALTIALSQFVWFAASGKLWTMVGYLLVAFGLVALFSLEALAILARRLFLRFASPKWIRGSIALALGAWIIFPKALTQANSALDLQLWRHSTVMALNDWASKGNVVQQTAIIFDDLAYFDPEIYPKSKMHGGVLTWNDVRRVDPDYIVLSSSLYDAAWYQKLRATQSLERDDPYPYSMRLYQDLLNISQPGPVMTGIDLVKIIEPLRPADMPAAGLPRLAYMFSLLWAPTTKPVVGPELRVFHLDRKRRPHPIAEGTAAGYTAANAFDQTASAWACGSFGQAAKACRIGYDFGEGEKLSVAEVKITWVYGPSTPRSIKIEYSDDAAHWFEAAVLDVPKYPSTSKTYREDTFVIPESGTRRLWRISAADIAEGFGFAVSEMKFSARK